MKKPVGIIGVLLSLWFSLALAAPTPAGTSIQNQASATYVDSAGQPRSTTSNLVVTVVQQVYSFTITPNGANEASPGQTRSGLPGSQVLFNYQVTNTGNGTDTINLATVQGTADNFDLTGVQIFLDANCNGNLDAGETTPITGVTLNMGNSACLIVRATLPTSATNGQYGNLNLTGTSVGNPNVKDNDNWARATATTAAALTAFKSASPSGNVTPGSTITYTVSGANTGGGAAYGVSVTGLSGTGILVADTIPSGLSVSSMPTGSAGAGTVSFVYSTDGSSWSPLGSSNLPLTGNGTVAIGLFISGSGAFFPQGASYTFSFGATVPTGAASGTLYTNSATVRFNDGTAPQTVTTNSTTNTVGAGYNVAVGPYGFPTAGASGTYTALGYTVTRSGDAQSIASVYDGTTVIFRHTLRNTGNAADSFTLGFSGAPTGWSCGLVADDLTTPISGPVGPVAAGADYNFALKCQVPAGATGNSFTLTVTATSVGDPGKTDPTTDTVTALADGFRLDLYGGVNGYGPYTQSQTQDGTNYTSDDLSTSRPPIYQNGTVYPSANPGAQVVYRLRVKNLNPSGQADNYTLLVQPGSGYAAAVDSLLFYPDANDDGLPDGPPISSTGLLGANGEFKYLAVVTLKNTAPPGPAGFSFAAQSSQSGAEPKDFAPTQINVNTLAQVSLIPDRSGTVTSPGTIQYTHTLTNSSNTGATCTVSGNGGSYGWTYQYSLDGTTWAPSLIGISLTPNGGNQTIYVRVLVPAGEPIGRTDVNTLTASCDVGSTSASAIASETTTVVGGDLRLSKSAVSYVGTSATVRSSDGSQAYPGDTLVYTVLAENIGTADLKAVKVADPLPGYTGFVSVSATATGFPAGATVLYSTDGTTWSTAAPTSLPAGGTVYVGVNTNGDGTIDGNDVMPPGAKITLTFKVQVQ